MECSTVSPVKGEFELDRTDECRERKLTLGREISINKGTELGNPKATRTKQVKSHTVAQCGNHLQVPAYYFYASQRGAHQIDYYKQLPDTNCLFL